MNKKDLKKTTTDKHNVFYKPNKNINKEQIKILEKLYLILSEKPIFTQDHENKTKNIIDILMKKNPDIFENTFFCEKGGNTPGYNIAFCIFLDRVSNQKNHRKAYEYLVENKLVSANGYADLDETISNFETILHSKDLLKAKIAIIKNKSNVSENIYTQVANNAIGNNVQHLSTLLKAINKTIPFSSLNNIQKQDFFSSFYTQDYYDYNNIIQLIENENKCIFQHFNPYNVYFISNYFSKIMTDKEIITNKTIESFLNKVSTEFLFTKYKDQITSYINKEYTETFGFNVVALYFPEVFKKIIQKNNVKPYIHDNYNFIVNSINKEDFLDSKEKDYIFIEIDKSIKNIVEKEVLSQIYSQEKTHKRKPL